MDNKVVQTLARAFVQLRLGQRALQLPRRRRLRRRLGRRPRRGRRCARGGRRRSREFAGLPLALAGFSFGGFVAVAGAAAAAPTARKPRRLVLVGPSTAEAAGAARAGRHAGDPRRERRRRAARRDARLGAAAVAAGDRLPRRRPFLPRPVGAAEKVVVRELRELADASDRASALRSDSLDCRMLLVRSSAALPRRARLLALACAAARPGAAAARGRGQELHAARHDDATRSWPSATPTPRPTRPR